MFPEQKLVFVYGTLLSGTASRMHGWLQARAELLGSACFQGRLYRLGDYPGVVPSRQPADSVRGEVYRLRRPGAVLPGLDAYEGYDPARPAASEYRREIRVVRMASGEIWRCWIYLYNSSTARYPLIPSGDFLQAPRLTQRIRAMERGGRDAALAEQG